MYITFANALIFGCFSSIGVNAISCLSSRLLSVSVCL